MKKIKVVQIGTAHDHAKFVMDSIKKQSDVFELVGYVNPEADSICFNMFKDTYSDVKELTLEEALEYPGLDAVVVESGELSLMKYAAMAIEKGLHVHIDKPGGEDTEEFAKVVNSAKEKNLVFSTGYMYRFNPAIKKMFEMVEKGELGQILSVEAQMNCHQSIEKRHWFENFEGGNMFFLGCHLIDIIYRLQGEPQDITAYNTSSNTDGVTAKDQCMAVFKYNNGCSFAKVYANECGGFLRRQLVVSGAKGTVEIKPIERYVPGTSDIMTDMRVVLTKDEDKDGWNAYGNETAFGPFDRYDEMMRNFAMIVSGERENNFDYDYEIRLHNLLARVCK